MTSLLHFVNISTQNFTTWDLNVLTSKQPVTKISFFSLLQAEVLLKHYLLIIKKNCFRQVVQYVLDHWSDYRSWRVNVCGDSINAVPNSFPTGNQYSLQRLQVEVDQFFLRAAQQIISAHRYMCFRHHVAPKLIFEDIKNFYKKILY